MSNISAVLKKMKNTQKREKHKKTIVLVSLSVSSAYKFFVVNIHWAGLCRRFSYRLFIFRKISDISVFQILCHYSSNTSKVREHTWPGEENHKCHLAVKCRHGNAHSHWQGKRHESPF